MRIFLVKCSYVTTFYRNFVPKYERREMFCNLHLTDCILNETAK